MGIETGIGAAIAGGIGLTGTAATVAGIAIDLAIAAALSAGSSALAKDAADDGPQKATRTGNIKNAIAPHEVVYGVVRKGGTIFFVGGSHFANTRLHMCIALAAHECEEIQSIYINGKENGLVSVLPSSGDPPYGEYQSGLPNSYEMFVPDTGNARRRFSAFNWRLGTSDQTAIPGMVLELDGWSNDHRARGICYLYARLVYDVTDDSRIWPSFIPSLTVRLKGRNDIYDPRDGTTSWTDNPALIAANILESLLNVPRERIDAAALSEAADICDQVVALKGGGTEKRYRASGYFSVEGEPEAWLEPVARAMAGAVIEHHGTYYIHAGAWREPVIEITDNDIMGAIRVRTAPSDRERSNVARGIFASAEAFDQPTEFPRVVDAAGVAEDGLELETDIDLEFVPSSAQAQRVAKILLLSGRSGRTVEIGTNLLKGLDVKPWDTVTLNLSVLGITGTFRVTEHKISIEDSPPLMKPTLTLVEISEDLYAWDAATEEQPLALQTAVVPGMDLEPQELSYSVAVDNSAATFFPATITANWTDPANTDFQAIEVQAILHFQFRTGPFDPWEDDVIEAASEVAPGVETLALDIIDADRAGSGFSFQNHVVERVRVRTRISANNWSDWTELEGDLRAPIAVNKVFTAYSSKDKHRPGAVKMYWDPPADGSPVAYEVEAKITYEWRQGAGAWIPAEYIEARRLKAKKVNLVFWDRSKPGGTTSFRNHVLNYARVRSVNGDRTVSEWTNL